MPGSSGSLNVACRITASALSHWPSLFLDAQGTSLRSSVISGVGLEVGGASLSDTTWLECPRPLAAAGRHQNSFGPSTGLSTSFNIFQPFAPLRTAAQDLSLSARSGPGSWRSGRMIRWGLSTLCYARFLRQDLGSLVKPFLG